MAAYQKHPNYLKWLYFLWERGLPAKQSLWCVRCTELSFFAGKPRSHRIWVCQQLYTRSVIAANATDVAAVRVSTPSLM
jgi:hypothetical protein